MRIADLAVFLAIPLCASGQVTGKRSVDLPVAPTVHFSAMWQGAAHSDLQPNPQAAAPAPQGAAPASPRGLTLKDAEALALKDNPQISVSRLLALASQQTTREVRSNLWPTANADITGVDSEENSRISAGGLNNPIIYERAAGGVTVSQLITDFGRTTNLVASANLSARAEAKNALATNQQVLLEVNQAFFNALQTHAVLKVAEETVNARQVVADQISALAKNKLKSELDLSFANVNLAQAKLLLLDAQNNDKAALANLSAVLGYSTEHDFILVEEQAQAVVPPGDVDSLIAQAFANRPEM